MERIYLVGFMGAGKTRVGRELAFRLGWTFVDLDAEIEAAEKMPVRQIFSRHGEPHFRRLEREHLSRLSSLAHAVIALGGGAYVDRENRVLVDSTGVAVWLKVSFDNVARRVTMDGSRPLFADRAQAERLYQKRLPFYSLAGIHVVTDNREPAVIVEQIAGRIGIQLKEL